MKIYILETPDSTRPKKQNNIYPAHNHDFGIEQDFYEYINSHPELITQNHKDADWHYLPIFWTRWHINHNYAQKGKKEIQNVVNTSIIDPKKTFTICQYDDGPVVDTHGAVEFLSSRKTKQGCDIPLLSKPHSAPWFKPKKKFLATFMGRLSTHKDREKMASKLNGISEIQILDGNFGTQQYIDAILKSNISLCPRGYGGSSFRFFESMQLGVVPLLFGEIDTRPFKNEINWDEMSMYASSIDQVLPLIYKYPPKHLQVMGKKAHKIWKDKLNYQKWCSLVIKELKYL